MRDSDGLDNTCSYAKFSAEFPDTQVAILRQLIAYLVQSSWML